MNIHDNRRAVHPATKSIVMRTNALSAEYTPSHPGIEDSCSYHPGATNAPAPLSMYHKNLTFLQYIIFITIINYNINFLF